MVSLEHNLGLFICSDLMNDNGSSDIIGSDRLDFVPYSIFIITERSNFVIHWVLLLRALFLRALDFRAPSFILVNKDCAYSFYAHNLFLSPARKRSTQCTYGVSPKIRG